MNGPSKGILASELILKLADAIREHGDHPVSSGGGDYPEGVSGVTYHVKGDGYIPANSFYIG